MPQTSSDLLAVAIAQLLLVDAGPWVRCMNWPWMVHSGGFQEARDGDSCSCEVVAEGRLAWGIDEACSNCASEASQHAVLPAAGWVVFHVSAAGTSGDAHCVVQRCSGQCMRASHVGSVPTGAENDHQLRIFVPKELCPEGTSMIFPEIGALGGKDGVLAPEMADLEFLRLFGPLKLQSQALHSVRTECVENAHRVVAKVCLQDGCDEWSKYSLPRCQVSLGLPYDFRDSYFVLSHSCQQTGQYYCPPGLPLALKFTLKAASRSSTLWAFMLEGLLPAVVAARRSLAAAFSAMDEGSSIARWAREWIEHEEMRMGCPPDLTMFSISRALHKLEKMFIGLPMALCPTCCRTAAGRLRVVFMRDPLARMSSFFFGYWLQYKGHLLPKDESPVFETWIRLILHPNASSSPLFEASDLDHVRPAFVKSPAKDEREVIFCIEDVEKSLRRVEDALCRSFRHCTPLPSFPAAKKAKRMAQVGSEVASLIRERYRFDYEAIETSC
ncbi:unnamed protein product [Symbiodinium natans]|uniref:Sulfotransferase domain-containing protein n=1 Tax=Symbiodinium natans TaxID=878477 RepID=A0A812NEQ1_9DINO|nr:unnamed protein product [Symbiodinium natans]